MTSSSRTVTTVAQSGVCASLRSRLDAVPYWLLAIPLRLALRRSSGTRR